MCCYSVAASALPKAASEAQRMSQRTPGERELRRGLQEEQDQQCSSNTAVDEQHAAAAADLRGSALATGKKRQTNI